jgi:hypothetical protein
VDLADRDDALEGTGRRRRRDATPRGTEDLEIIAIRYDELP